MSGGHRSGQRTCTEVHGYFLYGEYGGAVLGERHWSSFLLRQRKIVMRHDPMDLVLLGGPQRSVLIACSGCSSEDEVTNSKTGQRRLILDVAVQREWCRYVYAEYGLFSTEGVDFGTLLEKHIGPGSTWAGCWERNGAEALIPGDYLRRRRVVVRLGTPRKVHELYWDMCLGKDSVLDVDDVDCFTFNRREPGNFVSKCLEKIRRGAESEGFLMHGDVHCDAADVESVVYKKVQKYAFC